MFTIKEKTKEVLSIDLDIKLVQRVRDSLDASGVGSRKLRSIARSILEKEFEEHLAKQED